MIANLKTSIAIVGTAAILASPALAKTPHHGVGVPAYAYGAVVEPYYAPAPAQSVYAPNRRLPARPYQYDGVNPDFQLSHQ